MSVREKPHLEKLNSALENPKLPDKDKPKIENAIRKYDEWIEELLSAKRLSSNKRKEFDSVSNRRKHRDSYKKFLLQNPIHYDMVLHFLNHIKLLIKQESLEEKSILNLGYF